MQGDGPKPFWQEKYEEHLARWEKGSKRHPAPDPEEYRSLYQPASPEDLRAMGYEVPDAPATTAAPATADFEADFVEGDAAEARARQQERAAGHDGDDPLDGLAERVRGVEVTNEAGETTRTPQPLLAFEPAVIDAAVTLRELEPHVFESLKRELKPLGVGLTAWTRAIDARERALKAEAKERARVDAAQAYRAKLAAHERAEDEAELARLAEMEEVTRERPELKPHFGKHGDSGFSYEMEPGAVRMVIPSKKLGEDDKVIRLAYFSAPIIHNILSFDRPGGSPSIAYDLSVVDRDRGAPFTVEVPAERFDRFEWIGGLAGSRMAIGGASGSRENLCAALKLMSPAETRRRYRYSGWTKETGEWVYLHAHGAIGAEGEVEGLRAEFPDASDEFPDLSRFTFPAAPESDALVEGIGHCADLFFIDPGPVATALFGAVWRAALGRAPLSVFIVATQQTGKTYLTSLAQQHYGAGFNEFSVPDTWNSTAQGINGARAAVGDAVFLVDDFKRTGNRAADAKLEDVFNQVVRAGYGAAGRRRRKSDGTMAQRDLPPRSLLIGTGEMPPDNDSGVSRMLMVELPEKPRDLSAEMARGKAGVYSGVMAAYLRWLAPQLDEVRAKIPTAAADLKRRLERSRADSRSALLIAEALVGVDYFLLFAEESGLPKARCLEVWGRAWESALALLGVQAENAQEQNPALRAVDLWADGFRGCRFHLSSKHNDAPASCEEWGWSKTVASGMPRTRYGDDADFLASDGPSPVAKGARIGILEGDKVYLFPMIALAEAQKLAHELHMPLPLTVRTLTRQLQQAGLLIETERGNAQESNLVRKAVDGKMQRCIALSASVFREGVSLSVKGSPEAVSESPDTGTGDDYTFDSNGLDS